MTPVPQIEIKENVIALMIKEKMNRELSKSEILDVMHYYRPAWSRICSPHDLNNLSEEYMLTEINKALRVLKLEEYSSYQTYETDYQLYLDKWLDTHGSLLVNVDGTYYSVKMEEV